MNRDPSRLFRKAALEKMASPERLDEMMEVTSPAGWWALLALGAVLTTAILWSIFGRIPIKVYGNGILLRGGSVLAVPVHTEGRLREVLVEPNDAVAAGQVVARLTQPRLEQQLEQKYEELRTARAQGSEQGVASAGIVAQLQARRAQQEVRVAELEKLVSQGFERRAVLLSARAELTSIDQQMAQERSGRMGRSNLVEKIRREIELLEADIARNTEIKSPYAGRVLEVMADEGSLVGEGQKLLTLEPETGTVEAVLLIPAAEGKKVKEGMELRIAPSTVKPEEYGYILGTVRQMSDYPLTPEGMLKVLRNEKLVKTLADEGAQIEVVAELALDPATESGFRWSSSKGPPKKVATGTVCTASVIVEKKRPISYVIPLIKETFGFT